MSGSLYISVVAMCHEVFGLSVENIFFYFFQADTCSLKWTSSQRMIAYILLNIK